MGGIKANRDREFLRRQPAFPLVEICKAIADKRRVVSFTAHPITGTGDLPSIAYFAVKSLLDDGSETVILLDEFGGRILHGALQNITNWNWQAPPVIADGTKP